MLSEYIRISHSIDAITNYYQVAPTFKWVRQFEQAFKNEQGAAEKGQLLLNQLKQIEL